MALQRSAGNRAVDALLTGRTLAVQRFDPEEHLRLGDRGVPADQAQRVSLATDYSLTYGEMIAMSGDYFGSLAEMQKLAQIPGPGAGTREELEYVRVVKVRKGADDAFSQGAKDAADRRYVSLALDNRSHFSDPARAGAAGSLPGVGETTHEELRLKWNGIFPSFVSELVIPRAGEGYRHYHLEALFLAYVAGFEGRDMAEALAPEAFGAHYLTDSFSGGHLRTNRQSIGEYWNPKVPMFLYNLKGFIAQALATRIAAGTSKSTDLVFHGIPFNPGAMEEVSAALDEKAPLRFGDVVSGAVHDYDSENGVEALAEGRQVHLMGDAKLGGVTEELAGKAVDASHNDVTKAWFLGRQKAPMDSVLPAVTPGQMFGAEKLIPQAVADDQLPAEKRSVKWDFASVEELLADPVFQKALVIFGRRKADELNTMAPGLPEVARPHFGPAVVEPFRTAAVQTLTRVVHWTPDTGGGLFGHNQDDNAMDYYQQAVSSDAVATLTVEQRVRLCQNLLDGYTGDDEENAVYDLLTAEPAHSRAVISQVGWARLEDELGKRFTDKFPESRYR